MLTGKAGLLPRPVSKRSFSSVGLLGTTWKTSPILRHCRTFASNHDACRGGSTGDGPAQPLPVNVAKYDQYFALSSDGNDVRVSPVSQSGSYRRLDRNKGGNNSNIARKSLIQHDRTEETGCIDESWRKQVRTVEQLEYESEIASSAMPERGVRLIDNEAFQKNVKLWEILLQFRARTHGPLSVAPIWARLKSVEGLKPVSILSSNIVVQHIIEAGYHDQPLLDDFCSYVRETRAVSEGASGAEDYIYMAVLSYALQAVPSRAQLYHTMLRHLRPSRKQLSELVLHVANHVRASRNVGARETLQALSIDIPTFSGMYDLIIPKLCAEGYYEDAISWHSLLYKNGDLPMKSDSITVILPFLSQEELKGMAALGIGENNKYLNSEACNVTALPQVHKPQNLVHDFESISPSSEDLQSKASDELCTRLLTTRFFSLETIINGLGLLRVKKIGPQPLREILLRSAENGVCDLNQIRASLRQLHNLGIKTEQSIFACLVQKLVSDSDGKMLYDVATCDQSLDELENKEQQEKLLSEYEAQGDSREFNRTLAVLLVDVPESARETKLWNYRLRSALNQVNKSLVAQHLERMRYRNIPVTRQSRSQIFTKLLSERLPDSEGKVGIPSDQNLERYISLMEYILKGGNHVMPTEWDDSLRTLLFRGKLKNFEELMVFLLNWYSDPSFQSSHSSATSWVKGKPKSKHRVPWQSLLRTSRIHEIVQLGFYHGSLPLSKVLPLTGQDLGLRASKLAEHPTLWGVRFLAKLKESGFAIDRRIVKQACIYRLWAIFSVGLHQKPINKAIRNGRVGRARDYIAAMESIWGVGLFQRTVNIDDYAAQLVYLANRNSYFRWRILLRIMNRNGWRAFYKKSQKRDRRLVAFYKSRLLADSAKLEAAGMMVKPDPELYVEPKKFLEVIDSTGRE